MSKTPSRPWRVMVAPDLLTRDHVRVLRETDTPVEGVSELPPIPIRNFGSRPDGVCYYANVREYHVSRGVGLRAAVLRSAGVILAERDLAPHEATRIFGEPH